MNAESWQQVTQPGMTLGSYRIERLLGRGGMGAVFLAYDTTLRRSVALKVVDAAADDETSHGRVLREARNAAALNHPHICTIHEVGHASGATFIAMEHVEGRSLRDRLDASGALPLAEAVRYGLQAADALAYAHAHGVVHRDFKAANAMTTGDGRLKIVDFGLARRDDALVTGATTMGSVVPAGVAAGTPYAMAPEQVRGDPADARTDIWALGVLLYEMVTGVQPFTGVTAPELFSAILRDPPTPWPDGVAIAIKPVVERCLEKDPARRYQHAGEVRAALEAIQSGMVPLWTAWRYQLARRRWLAPAAALLVVGAAVVGFNAGGVRDRLVGRPAPIKLAVLPFENLTGDPAQEYFSDGLTEETITQLGRLHPQRLSVIGRTSSMRYKNRNVSLAQIGRDLGVDFVLEGSARREGTRVRVTATLIDVRDQTQRWANSFERELASILALQSDIARGVSGSLALALLPAEQARLDAVKTVNPEAYEAVLWGRSHVIKVTREDLDTALRYFELALQKDPDYGLAYAGIANVWSGRRQLGFAPPAEATPRVKAAAAKAIELLGDDSSYAHLRLALDATFTDWNWAAAEPSFRRAIDLAPNDAEARAFYAHYLEIMHRPAEAMTEMQRAIALDPLSELIQSLYGATLSRAGRLDEAIVNAQNIVKTTPNSSQALSQLSTALHRLQRYEEALAAEQRHMAARSDRQLTDALTQGYAEAGYRGAMLRVADALAARPFARGRAPGFYVRAGEHERALDVLEQGVERRDPAMPYVGVQEIYEPLRSHPRFQALLRKMNLPL